MGKPVNSSKSDSSLPKKEEAHGKRHRQINIKDTAGAVTSYEVLRTLGKGSWGKVVKAKNKKTDTISAIKVQKIDVSTEKSKEIIALIKNEAHVGMHVGFTQTIFFRPSKKDPHYQKAYMVNEFCPGKDLSKLIKEGKYTPQEFLVIMRNIFGEIHRLHQLGVIHADVKPANFIVNKDLTVKAVDYGFAAIQGVGNTDARGTPGYSPSEILIGAPVSQAGDIYSTGISIVEGLRQAHDETLTTNNHNIKRILPNPNLEKDLAKACPNLSSKQLKTLTDIIRKMTKQSPSQRLKPEDFAKMIATYDREILQIPEIPQVVKNVSKTLNEIIAMLEKRAIAASPLEKKAIQKSLGKNTEFTPEELKNPKTLYALKAKIEKASAENCQDFNFARQIMGDLRHITKYRLSGNKFTSSINEKMTDAPMKLLNRILPINPWTNLSVSGAVAAAREEVEKRVQNNFRK